MADIQRQEISIRGGSTDVSRSAIDDSSVTFFPEVAVLKKSAFCMEISGAACDASNVNLKLYGFTFSYNASFICLSSG